MQDTVVYQQTNGKGSYALASRKGVLGSCEDLAVIAGAAEHLSMAQDQYVLHEEVATPVQFLQKAADVIRGNSLGLRSGPGKGLLRFPEGQGLFLRSRGEKGLRSISYIKNSCQKLISSACGGEVHRRYSFGSRVFPGRTLRWGGAIKR